MARVTRSTSSATIKRKKQPSNFLFLLNALIESLLIIDPLARVVYQFTGSKPFTAAGINYSGYSLLFPGVSNQTGVLVLNLFTAAVVCFCAIPSFLVYYWKLPKSESRMIAGGSVVYHLALGSVLAWNWYSGGDPMGAVLLGEGEGEKVLKHALGVGIHSVLFLGFVMHFASGRKIKEE